MWIKSLTPENFGPFSTPTTIELDRHVTVLTGANDTGKSSFLTALKMYCRRTKAAEHHVNLDRFGRHDGPWNSDGEVKIGAELVITEESVSSGQMSGSMLEGDQVRFVYSMNSPSDGYQFLGLRRKGTKVSLNNIALRKAPKVIELDAAASIRSVVNLEELTSAETELLKVAFGSTFSTAALKAQKPHVRALHLTRAEELLNSRLAQFFPPAMNLRIRLTDIGGEGKALGINIIDGFMGFSPIDMRGTGVRKLLALMGVMLQSTDAGSSSLLLLDEPETSLHADAQHKLRRIIEEISVDPKMQVVYATHSPSMVNPGRPERVRVFSRSAHNGYATTLASSISYAENFQQVRTSLGLTPADSLLYGLVTVIVEGDTETRCLGKLLTRLDKLGADGFAGAEFMLQSCHFVCGAGDSISYYCKLAADQGSDPIVFLGNYILDKPTPQAYNPTSPAAL